MRRRIFSLLVALCMIVGLLPPMVHHAHAEATTKKVRLMSNSGHEVVLTADDAGTVAYTKNKKVTLTAGGVDFAGYVQEPVQVTNETTDEWNVKFYYDTATMEWTLVLKGAKFDAYDDDNSAFVENVGAICLTSDMGYHNDFELNVVVKESSSIECYRGMDGNPSKGNLRWQSLRITGEGEAKLDIKAKNRGIVTYCPIYLNVNLDINTTSAPCFYVNSEDKVVYINGGNINVVNPNKSGSLNFAFYFKEDSGNYLCLKGGTLTVNAGYRVTNRAAVIASCQNYVLKDEHDVVIENPVLTDQNYINFVSNGYAHTPGEAVLDEETNELVTSCSVCKIELTRVDASAEPACEHTNVTEHVAKPSTCTELGNTAYYYCNGCEKYFAEKTCETEIAEDSWMLTEYADCVPNADDGDCTTEITCSICGKETTAAAESHAFDNDCTTADKCENCDVVAEKADAHAFDKDCTTADKCENCDVVAEKADAHAFDKDCTTADKCENCDVVAEKADAHAFDGDCTTADKCENCDVVAEKADAHAFDGDCTTADKCANCDVVAEQAAAHVFDGDCTTADKCENCDVVAEQAAAHVFDGDCTTADKCENCDVVAEKADAHAFDGDCTTADKCANCDVVAEKADAHAFDKDCTTADKCENCEQTATTGEHTYDDVFDAECNACGTVRVPATVVAQIGENKYETLAEAVAEADPEDTIVLMAPVAGSGIVIDKSITIDFNGKTYTFNSPAVGSSGTQTLGFQILKGDVTLTNGKLAVAEAAKHDFAMLIQNYTNLTIEKMELDGTYLDRHESKDYNYSYVLSNNSGNVVIADSIIKANDNGDGYAFDACKYSTYAVPNVEVNGNSVINGIIEVTGGNLYLTAGTINGKLAYTSGAVTKAAAVALDAPADYKWVDGVLTAKTYVAQIGENKYETLAEAIAVGGEVTLLADVELDASIVIEKDKALILNLGTYKISYTSEVMGEAMITNRGTLTINGEEGSEIYYNYVGKADSSYGKGNYTISNGGTLTVNGGKIHIADLRAHAKFPIDNNSTSGDAVLVINGGHLYNYNTSAIRQFCNSTTNKNSVTIDGGLIEGYCAIWMQNPGKNTVKGDLTINGGEIKTTAAAYVNGTADLKDVSSHIYCTIDGEGGAWSDDSFMNFNGGTFNENVDVEEEAPAIVVGEKALFNGRPPHTHTFEAVYTEPTFEADGFWTYTCSCGEIEKTVIEEGSKKIAVAEVNGTKYGTLAEAIAAADAGDTVTLLTNITGASIGKDITLDLGAHNITSNNPDTSAPAILVKNSANVTITGTGTVTANGPAVWAYGGDVTIEGGNYVGGYHAVYASIAGKVVINGGKYSIMGTDAFGYVLNVLDEDRDTCTITVNGGEFVGFDPANNNAEGANTNFLAEGLHTKCVDDDDDVYSICTDVAMDAVKENVVAGDCTTDGSYDLVVYCECGKELSREHVTVTAPGHTNNDGNDYCDVCKDQIGGIINGYYYENGSIIPGKGLVEEGGNIYFIDNNGQVAKGEYYVSAAKANGLAEAGYYEFDAVTGAKQMREGIYRGFYYVNDEIVALNSLIEIDGKIYFIGSKGQVAKGEYYVSAEKANGLVNAGVYEFNADTGAMKMNNGIVDGVYYENGSIVANKGLIKVGEEYFFVGSKGQVAKGEYYVSAAKANGLAEAGYYEFDAVTGAKQMREGIYRGFYYVNDEIVALNSLIEIDGKIYFIGSKGQVAKGEYYVSSAKTAGYVKAGIYEFDATTGELVTDN